ncbi:hypothetical protein NHH03_25275 [Stieleria sp. TO1_6]|uniref:hypothetical protein n=1 Tax=Stieleria tagensis TaxID=2956795 RepID=UPI00209AAA26|nr:hypothetical protein [Stieleria tagensis]MCO8125073.1 hypothetical protein [Stieleria tagensis]
MAKQKKGLTAERHREIAEELRRVEAVLLSLAADVADNYPKRLSRPVLKRIDAALGLRGELDDLACHDRIGIEPAE